MQRDTNYDTGTFVRQLRIPNGSNLSNQNLRSLPPSSKGNIAYDDGSQQLYFSNGESWLSGSSLGSLTGPTGQTFTGPTGISLPGPTGLGATGSTGASLIGPTGPTGPSSALTEETLSSNGPVSTTTEYTFLDGGDFLSMTLSNPTGVAEKTIVSLNNTRAVINTPMGDVKSGPDESLELVYSEDNGEWIVIDEPFGVFGDQDAMLIGTGATGAAEQGYSVTISDNGLTVVTGGPSDDSNRGAVWVFVKSNGSWTQQGSKLVPSGSGANASAGTSVALARNTDTLAIGGPGHGANGAAWVYTRTAGVWSEQTVGGLIGTGGVGSPNQGTAVALSDDGNTLAIGGSFDNTGVGATWIFTRSGAIWTQQGGKLVGSGSVGSPGQGSSVALSSDGNTLAIGGPGDNSSAGAVWVFTRTAGVWTQQGNKIIGSGAVGSARQGSSVSLSGDGNLLVVGGPNDNGMVGATWVFTRYGGVWQQQGSKLVGSHTDGSSNQGSGPQGVSVNYLGNVLLVGGLAENEGSEEAWVFVKYGSVWSQQGSKLRGSGTPGIAISSASVSISSNSIAAVGSRDDNNGVGTVWVFV